MLKAFGLIGLNGVAQLGFLWAAWNHDANAIFAMAVAVALMFGLALVHER